MGMMAIGLITGFLLAQLWGFMRRPSAVRRVPSAVRRVQTVWQKLPSGWSRDVAENVTIHAMVSGGCAYWWVVRNSRTVIEGPSSSLDMAKIEAEREAHELTRP